MDKADNRNLIIQSNMEKYTPTQVKMATNKLSSLVIRYSLPTMAGMLINALYNVVDRFWIGKLPGTAALTGVGVVMPIMNIIMAFAQLVGIGTATNISIKLGQNDKEGAQRVLNNALVLSLIFSVIISAVGVIFAPQIMRLVGASDETLPHALAYGRIIVGFSVFQMTSFSMNHAIRATGNPTRFASTQFLGAVVNMILDPLFIFTFNMGAAGAAIATVIAQFASAVWIFSYYFQKDSQLRFKLPDMKLDSRIVKAIFAIGLSPFLMQVSGALVNGVLNNTLGKYGNIAYGAGGGDLAIGAMALINSISMLILMPVIGINQGTQPIIGFNYGRRDYSRVKGAYTWACVYGTIICSAGWVAVRFFAPELVAIFSTEPDLVEITSRGMRTYLFCLPVIGYQAQSSNFFTAIGRAKLSIFVSALRQIILLIPLYIILPQFFGLFRIWYAGPIADFCAAALAGAFIVKEFKVIDKREENEINQAMRDLAVAD